MGFEQLSDREKQVLMNLIQHYISSADPVGSRAIAHRFQMGLSAATIRNTLQDLEELGLIESPHTSAGRIPTDRGYRVYIDHLFKPEPLNDQEKQFIRSSLLKEGRGLSDVLVQTARVLYDITHQLGVTIAPKFEEGVLKQLRLIPIADGRIMVVVIVGSGVARSIVIEVEAIIRDTELLEFESLLNERLAGLSLREIRQTITERLQTITSNGRLLKLVIDSKDKLWQESSIDSLHYAGADQLVRSPEFADRERLSQLMRMLGDSSQLADFLRLATDEGLVITIGKENTVQEIMNCSLVTSTYKVGGISGTIGIIGPTRMPYTKLVSIVEYTAKSITDVLSGLEGRESTPRVS